MIDGIANHADSPWAEDIASMRGHDEEIGAWRCVSVNDFPRLEYTMGEVRRAGERLAQFNLQYDANTLLAFQIAESFRQDHAYPMRRLRGELVGCRIALKLNGRTVSRLKHMPSIRRKLRKIPAGLNQIQDLGGCRTILPTVGDANRMAAEFAARTGHPISKIQDYNAAPKPGGYRSLHLMLRYGADNTDDAHKGRRIEAQFRSVTQHSWSTAVEAMGTLRGELMKAGEGAPDWLRLFELMSAELAMAERQPIAAHLPAQASRRAEIKDLDYKLGALATLENMRVAFRFADDIQPNPRPEYYLITYDNASREVRVDPKFNIASGLRDYAQLESDIRNNNSLNTVLVEASSVAQLKEAFPNYFLDVQLFSENLRNIVQGRDAREFTFIPPARVRPSDPEDPDPSWLRRTGRRQG